MPTKIGDPDPLVAAVPGAEHHVIGGAQIDIVPAGAGRVKRTVYPSRIPLVHGR